MFEAYTNFVERDPRMYRSPIWTKITNSQKRMCSLMEKPGPKLLCKEKEEDFVN